MDQGGESPLHNAAFWGRTDAIDVLLEGGANPNVAGGLVDSTPLHKAAARGHADSIARLLKGGADPKAVDASGETPLHEAATGGVPSLQARHTSRRSPPYLKRVQTRTR